MREVGHWMVKFTTDDRCTIGMDTVDGRARIKLAIVDNKIYCPELYRTKCTFDDTSMTLYIVSSVG